MISLKKPQNFSPRFEVAGCFVEYNEKILLLHRQDNKPQGNTWGVPAGKLEKGESASVGICRELFEEIGLSINSNTIEHLHRVYVTHDGYSFIYHICRYKTDTQPVIIPNTQEHKGYRWVTPNEALSMSLIADEAPCIELVYKGSTIAFS